MLKKVLAGLAIAFLLYYVITQPQSAAAAFNTLIDWIVEAFQSIITFFTALV